MERSTCCIAANTGSVVAETEVDCGEGKNAVDDGNGGIIAD